MSYRLPNKQEGGKGGGVTTDEVVTASKLEQYIADKLSSEDFYELEPVEVLEVFEGDFNEDSEIYKVSDIEGNTPEDYSYVGGIKGRYIYSQQGVEDAFEYFRPLNPNIYSLPAQHDVVIGVKYLGNNYYTSILNAHGNNNFHQIPNVSMLKDFKGAKKTFPQSKDEKLKRDDKARRIMPFAGDVIVEGRFKNHIRLGSNIRNDKEDSPNMQFVVGHLMNGDSDPDETKWRNKDIKKQLEEPFLDDPDKKNTREKPLQCDIDKDAASIYLTTDEDLFVTPPFKSQYDEAVPPYTDKNILLNSDRIIFNAQNEGSIILSSTKNIIIGSKEEVIVETPKMLIGGKTNNPEPMVLGNKLLEVLNNMMTMIVGELFALAPVKPLNPQTVTAIMTAINGDGKQDLGILSKEHAIIDNATAKEWKKNHPKE